MRGFIFTPYTQNHYSYCWNNPEEYVDLNGRSSVSTAYHTGYTINVVNENNTFTNKKQNSLADSMPNGASLAQTATEVISDNRVYNMVIDNIRNQYNMPNFVKYTDSKGKDMVRVLDSEYYSGRSIGINTINETKLLRRGDSLTNAYNASNVIKKVDKAAPSAKKVLGSSGKLLGVLSFGMDFYDEYKKGADLPQEDRLTNAVVEASVNLGVDVATGAMGGIAVAKVCTFAGTAIFPGPGTIIGAVAGVVLGIGVDYLINISFFDHGSTSVMDKIKSGANKAVDFIGELDTSSSYCSCW